MLELSPFSRAIAPAAFVGQDLRVSESRHEAKRLLMGDPQVLASVLEPWLLTPPHANTASMSEVATLLWLSPRQWLLLTTTDVAKRACEAVGARGSCSAHDVGARFVGLTIEGARAAEFLTAGCGLDLRDHQFRVGSAAQTRIEQAPVILFRLAARHYEVMVERPLAPYLWRWAQEVARDWSGICRGGGR
jgi:heterotetrameric sarcosine oxidase gamma subunit